MNDKTAINFYEITKEWNVNRQRKNIVINIGRIMLKTAIYIFNIYSQWVAWGSNRKTKLVQPNSKISNSSFNEDILCQEIYQQIPKC